MSGESKSASISGNLALDDSGKGPSITGNVNTIAAKNGLKVEDDIVAATINLGNLDKSDVHNILENLKPYENNMKVLTKKDLNAGAALDSFGLGLKNAPEGLLKTDLSLDSSADPPAVSLNGLSGRLNAEHGLGGKTTGPTLNGDLPKLSLNKPSGDAGATMTMPSMGLPGSDIKADLDGSLKGPDVSGSVPQIKIPNASLKIDKPHLRTGKYQAPKFSMPNFKLPQIEPPKTEMDISGDVDLPSVSGNVDTSDLNLSAPKFAFQSPDLDLNGPKGDFNGPDLKLEAPNADIEAPSGKIKWPHLKWKSAKVKELDTDLDAEISIPDVNVPTAKVDGNLCGPGVDIDFPKADIKGHEVDVKTPDLDLDPPSGKINWPHLKWKKPKLHGSKDGLDIDGNIDSPDVDISVPKVKGGLDAPDVDINLPKAAIKGPDVDVQTSNIDVEAPAGKINWPHLKWKKPKLQGPKADLGIDGDLKTPDLTIASPKIEGDMNVPEAELNLPKADLSAPDVHVQASDVDVDAPSGKINWPHLKWKKPKLHGQKAEVDTGLNAPDLNLSAPEVDGKIDSPDIDLNLPKADVNVAKPGIDIDSPSGKFKWPTFNKPKWSISQPKVNGPDVDLDADVSAPDLDLSAPKINGKIDSPDIDLNLPKADVEKPEIDIEPPSGKFKWPTFNKPKWSISQPKVNGPDVDLDANVSAPNLNLSAPKIDGKIDSPDIDLNLPKADVEKPEIDIDSPSGKFKWPTFNKPKWSISQPKVNGPDVDLDANVSAPNLNLSAPKIDGDIHAPDRSLQAPKTELQGHKLDLNAKLPNAELEAPDVTIKPLNLDINPPKTDLKAPDVGLDAHFGDFKMPYFKVPALDPSSPNTEFPNVHATGKAGIEAPKVNIGRPTADASVSVPEVELNGPKVEGPKVDIKTLDIDANVEKSKFPHFRMPKFSFSGAKMKSGEVNASANTDDDDASNDETNVPVFKFHTLPKQTLDGFSDISDGFGLSKRDGGENDFVVRKGIRLPISTTSKATGKIDIMERLKLAKEKTASVLQTDDKNDVDLKLATPSLDVSASAEAGDSSLVRGGTFKIEKPESVQGSADESQRLSQGLSNMLYLGFDDPDVV